MRSRRRRFGERVLILAAIAAVACAARAADPPPERTDEAGTSRAEVLNALHDIQHKYGSDAVLMEGHLLAHAIRSGSILEAEISVPGFEDRDGKRFLGFKLETGIIYNDRETATPARVERAWTDIVEASLRKFRTVTFPADGLAFTLGYTHKPYADEADLRTHLRDGHGEAEAAMFYVLLPDVIELIANHITSQQLIDRSTVLVNGAPVHVVLAQPSVAPQGTPAGD